METQKNILLLDGDLQSAQEVLDTLHKNSQTFKVSHAFDIEGGIKYLNSGPIDVVLLSGQLVNSPGIESLRNELATRAIPCILLSDVNGAEVLSMAERTGAKDYLVKGKTGPAWLPKTIMNTLRLTEAEKKLDIVFEEYSQRIESFSVVVERMKEPVFIANAQNELVYTNAAATSLMEKPQWETFKPSIAYRSSAIAETFETTALDTTYAVNVSPITWDAEPCNLFIVEKAAVVAGAAAFATGLPAQVSAPVMKIMENMQQMAGSMGVGNFDQAAEFAGNVQNAVMQTGEVLKRFGSFLELNTQQPEITNFPMKELVGQVLAEMKPSFDAKEAEVNVSELPKVNADRGMAGQLLRELLNNALRFSKPGKKPVIDIGHDVFEGETIFCVRDNGMGVSRKNHEKIFGVFETLNAETGAQGMGLGLAICKKIAGLHNGKIWVEGLPGHGSNFYFTFR
ncbi:MAG TPA: response regulator [Chitinophagales bacterium]|nr:response regulator [Chitinophagales bacterium]